MKNILPIFLVVTLLLAGFEAFATPETNYNIEKQETILFSEPIIRENEDKQ